MNTISMNTVQKMFETVLRTYNEDYYALLKRAGAGDYNCLTTSFRILKDVYDLIEMMKSIFQVQPIEEYYSLNFDQDLSLLDNFLLTKDEIINIKGFLRYVRAAYDLEFHQVLLRPMPARCPTYRGKPDDEPELMDEGQVKGGRNT